MAEPSWYTKANNSRLSVRKSLADELDEFAAALSGTSGERGRKHEEVGGLHRRTAKNLTHALNRLGLPPEVAAGGAELAGWGNEALTGGLQSVLALSDLVGDKPITHATVGPAGWDPEDIYENQIGEQEALATGLDFRPKWLQFIGRSTHGAAPELAAMIAGRLLGDK